MRARWAAIPLLAAAAYGLWRVGVVLASPAVDRIVTVRVGDVPRVFHLHAPAGRSGPAPLVLDFHGWGSSSIQQMQLTGLDALADREAFIVAHAEGVGALASFNAGACCGEAVARQLDDVGFARAIIDAVSAEFQVDHGRVFAMGFSNGGFLVHRLACELSDRIAAVASVAGNNGMPRCTPTRPVSVLEIHGTADDVVRYLGGGPGGFAAIEGATRTWAARNRCEGLRADWQSDRRQLTKVHGKATCETYGSCAEGTEVTLCRIDGGGHTWPGGPSLPELGVTTHDLDATQEAWRFFAAHGR